MEQERKENKYKIEEIIWNDCRSLKNSWEYISQIQEEMKDKSHNPIIYSVGFVVYEDETHLVLAASIDTFAEDEQQACGGMIIYKPQIMSRRIIKNG